MNPSVIAIQEHGSCLFPLHPRDYHLLRARYSGKLDFVPTDTPGLYRLTARDYVGRARLSPDLLLVIRPKVPTPNLLYMLAAAAGLAEFHAPYINLEASEDVVTLLAVALVTETERLLQGGLRADFAPREGDLPLVRGRVMLNRQLTRYGDLKHRHVCAYAERSPDTPENRVILATLLYISALLSPQEAPLTKRIRALIPRFEGVARIFPAQAASLLRNVRPRRQTMRYTQSLALCALILNHLGLANLAGRHPFPSFLIDMPRLFESYLTARLHALLPQHALRVVAQRHDYLDEAGRVRIRPDILIYPHRGNTPIFVVDAKYRASGIGGDDRSGDLYQLGAYMGRYGLERGALVYPQHDPTTPSELRLRGTGERVHLFHLDLTSPTPNELEQSCTRLAKEIARLSLQ